MPNTDMTAKLNIDISNFKKGIQDANRQMRLANAEFKSASSALGDWQKSTEGVQAKITQLNKVLDNQKKILDVYEKQLDEIVKAEGENSKGADEMRIKIENQKAAINKTTAELEKYDKVLDDLEKEQEQAAKSAEEQDKAYNKLQKTVNDQQKHLDALKDEYKQVVLEQGKDSEAAKKLAREIDELSGELKDNKTALKEADDAADDLDNSLDDVGDAAGKAEGGFTILKGALADLASHAIQAVISGLKDMAKAAADAWKEFDEGRDTVIKLTGATGDMAKELTKSYGNVAKGIVADGSDIGNAVGEVSTRFGLQGEALEELSTQYLKFAKITGADVISSIDDTQKALSAYGLKTKDANTFLDALAKTSQQTGVDTSTLTNGIISNATAFQEMGLSVEQAVAFMGQLETSGANSETVLNGMRKALKNSAKDGLSLDDALITLQKQIQNGTNSMDGLNAAYALFGKSGDQIYGAIKNGTLSFEDLTSAVINAEGAVNDTYDATLDATDRVQLQLQNLKVSAAEVIDEFLQKHGDDIEALVKSLVDTMKTLLPLFGELAAILPKIAPLLVSIGAGFAAFKVATLVSNLVSGFKTFFMVLKSGEGVMAALNAVMAVNPIFLIISAVAALVAAFIYLWNTSEEFRNFWLNLWEGLKLLVKGAVDAISEWWNGLGDKFIEVWESIKQFFADLWEGIKTVISAFIQWYYEFYVQPLINLFKPVLEFFKTVWQIIKELAVGCVEAIKAVWGVVSSWFGSTVIEPVKSKFTEFWDALKTKASEVWEFIKAVWTVVSEWFNSTIIQPVTTFFDTMWTKLKDGAKQAWEGVKSVFSPIADWFREKFRTAWEAVKKVFSTGGAVFQGIQNGIVSAFKAVVNAIIRGINRVIAIPFNAINNTLERIRNVSIAGVRPFAGVVTRFNVPQIPTLARGGVLGKGQIGLLEGDGAEAVVPLDQNRKWISAVTAELKKTLQGEGMLGAGGATIGGATYTFIQNNNSPKALSRLDIYRQTQNQLNYARGV